MPEYKVKLTLVIVENDMQDAMKTAEVIKSDVESAINSDDTIHAPNGVKIKSVKAVEEVE